MTRTEIRNLRARLELTQGAAARLVGVSDRTWRGWEAGERNGNPCDIPEPVARLLHLAETVQQARAELERMGGAGVGPLRSRPV
jgi:DNA-binding transcriptional regulator YiaG